MLSSRYEDLLKRYGYDQRRVTPPSNTSPKIMSSEPVLTSKTFSPELSGLEHSSYMQNLLPGLDERGMRDIFNFGRSQIQTGTKVALEQMAEKLGSKGFRAGESGIADTALGGIAKEGQRELGRFTREMTISERIRRFQEALAKGEFGLKEKEVGLREEEQKQGSINQLLQLYAMALQNQATRYQPYWAGLVQSYTA